MASVIKREKGYEPIDQVIRFVPESDDFQKNSFWGVSKDMCVLSNAPTGSGKTRIIYYSAAHYLNKGGSVAVTIPIKALSNQKYWEFITELIPMIEEQCQKTFSVGIMTGDTIINPDADLIVMTTEILNESLNVFGDKEGKKQTHLKPNFIERLQCVVFDEAHYINDEDRGHVWESILIKLPKNVNTVLLSATFPNIDSIAEWLSEVRNRDVCLVEKKDRIVPLSHYLFHENSLVEVMNSKNCFNQPAFDQVVYSKNHERGQKVLNSCIEFLKEKDLLQAIFFVFSKANCEKFALEVTKPLVDYEERAEIEKIYNSKMHKHDKDYSNTPQFILAKKLLQKGICFHHAEVIPVLKEIIEILFMKGLIKVLFVTETFSVGLNMPTRTVVFTSCVKPSSSGFRNLFPHEYNQMSGRAGRRGKDKVGYVVHIPYFEYSTASEAKSYMCGNMSNIKSKMKIDYQFILKALSTNTSVEYFMSKSLFARELAQDKKKLQYDIDSYKLPELELDQETKKDFDEYVKILNMSNDMGMIIKLNKKQQKKKDNLVKKYKDDKRFIKYISYLDMSKELESKKKALLYCNYDLPRKIDTCIQTLLDMEFLYKDNNQTKVNLYGIVAAQINECNPLIMSTMILGDAFIDDPLSPDLMFYGLKAPELVALLSVFIKDSNRDPVHLNDVKCSEIIKNRIQKIKYIIDYYQKIENNRVDTPEDYWNLNYNNIEAVYNWAEGGNFLESLNLINGPQGGGSFIKNTIKINNLANDIIALCKVCNNTKLLTEFSKIEPLILRDQVTVKSLYID